MINVLGTCAFPGSGQDTFANELAKRLDITVYSMGDILRNIAKENNLEPTREVLQQIRKDINKNKNSKFIANELVIKINKNNKPAIITGIRLLDEVSIFKDKFNFKLIFVWAEKEIRYNRILLRGQEKDPNNLDGFTLQSKKEEKLFEIKILSKGSDCVIDCNMLKDEFINDFEKTINSMGSIYTNFHHSLQKNNIY